jgi:branched-chain amino acid transport system ATP-binding protein
MSGIGESNVLLETRSLTRSFGALVAVNGVDWSLDRGERHGIIGPNGSGKSTFLKLLAGVLQPSTGEIRLDDRSISRWSASKRARAGIQLKFQVPRVFNELTVAENLELAASGGALRPDGRRGAIRRADLAQLNLEGHEATRAGELAHGHRQWLEIGMALASSPRILLLDEPTAGMPPSERADTVSLLRRMRCTLVVVEHDIPMVVELCDRMTLLHEGRIRASGPINEVLEDPVLREAYIGERDADVV